ncbi:hypothetical protein NMG60_11012454 [Bertholletia excelsa]
MALRRGLLGVGRPGSGFDLGSWIGKGQALAVLLHSFHFDSIGKSSCIVYGMDRLHCSQIDYMAQGACDFELVISSSPQEEHWNLKVNKSAVQPPSPFLALPPPPPPNEVKHEPCTIWSPTTKLGSLNLSLCTQ